MAEQRQRVRHQNGRGQSLHTACGDQKSGIGRQRAGDRGRREDGTACHEYPLGADSIAERTRGQNESRKGDRIGTHHPLQFGNPAAERRSDGVERGVDDGEIKLNDAVAEAHPRERQRGGKPRGPRPGLRARGNIDLRNRLEIDRSAPHDSPHAVRPNAAQMRPFQSNVSLMIEVWLRRRSPLAKTPRENCSRRGVLPQSDDEISLRPAD
jgi:hypothetical protein